MEEKLDCEKSKAKNNLHALETNIDQSKPYFFLLSFVILSSIDNEKSESKTTTSTAISVENSSSESSSSSMDSQPVYPLNVGEISGKRSFMDTFGIPVTRVRVLHVFLFASDYINSLRHICAKLIMYLSMYGLFCEINAFDKKEYKMILDGNHCDLCIADKDFVDEVKTNYPSLSCSVIDFSYPIVHVN